MKFIKDYNVASDLPDTLPVFPLAGALLLPRADLPLNIFEPRYLEMMSDALSGERIVGMIQPTEGTAGDENPRLMKIGCAGRITSYTETPDGRMMVTLTGISRFSISKELKATNDGSNDSSAPKLKYSESDLDILWHFSSDRDRETDGAANNQKITPRLIPLPKQGKTKS